MFKNNSSYFVEFTQASAKVVMKDPQNYFGKLITEIDDCDKEVNYLQFVNQKTGETLKFSLHQVKPLPKVSIAFFDSKEPTIDTRVEMKCIAINQEKGKKRPRAIVEIDSEESDSDEPNSDDESGSEVRLRGWSSRDEERNNRIRHIILKILQDHPSGNISPMQVRREVFNQGQHPIQKFVKEYMESVCEQSVQRSNRKYILMEKYRPIESSRKRVKPNQQ